LVISKLINSLSVWYLTVSDVSFEAALYISDLLSTSLRIFTAYGYSVALFTDIRRQVIEDVIAWRYKPGPSFGKLNRFFKNALSKEVMLQAKQPDGAQGRLKSLPTRGGYEVDGQSRSRAGQAGGQEGS